MNKNSDLMGHIDAVYTHGIDNMPNPLKGAQAQAEAASYNLNKKGVNQLPASMLSQLKEAYKPKIYTAASTLAYEEILRLPEHFPTVEWTASWPKLIGTIPQTQPFAAQFWRQDFKEIQKSNYVMVLGFLEHSLCGALVEAGYAIALGKKILLIGEHPGFGTWQHYPGILKFPDVKKAVLWLEHFHR